MRNELGYARWVAPLVIVILVVLPFAIWGASVLLAPLFGAGEAYKQTEGSDYRIANYERFKNDCNAIVATEGKIATAQEAVDNEVKGEVDSFREQQLSQNLQALENVRLEQISQYNADASKNETRAKFKDAGLPESINPNAEIGAVSCPSE